MEVKPNEENSNKGLKIVFSDIHRRSQAKDAKRS